MKRLLVFVFATILLAAMATEAKVFENGKGNLNAGIGLGSTLVGDITLPPISASYELGFTDQISVGGFLGFALSETDWFYGTWSYTHIIIGPRASYHIINDNQMDIYGGLMIGYNIVSSSYTSKSGYDDYDYSSADGSGLTYSLHAGGRYMFNEKFGIYGELGYGVAYLNFGLTVKM